MKKFLLMAAMVFVGLAAQAQTQKVVVDRYGNTLGRYEGMTNSTYLISGQSADEVSKAGNHVETWSAAQGKGYVQRRSDRTGNINVRKSPTTNAAVVAKIPDIPGDLPEWYRCLGKTNGWYKIRIDGKVGYVRQDMVNWDIDQY